MKNKNPLDILRERLILGIKSRIDVSFEGMKKDVCDLWERREKQFKKDREDKVKKLKDEYGTKDDVAAIHPYVLISFDDLDKIFEEEKN